MFLSLSHLISCLHGLTYLSSPYVLQSAQIHNISNIVTNCNTAAWAKTQKCEVHSKGSVLPWKNSFFFFPPGYTLTIRETQLLQNINAALVRNCNKLKKLLEQRSNLSGIKPHLSSLKNHLCAMYTYKQYPNPSPFLW